MQPRTRVKPVRQYTRPGTVGTAPINHTMPGSKIRTPGAKTNKDRARIEQATAKRQAGAAQASAMRQRIQAKRTAGANIRLTPGLVSQVRASRAGQVPAAIRRRLGQ